jgi:hypothetical protein
MICLANIYRISRADTYPVKAQVGDDTFNVRISRFGDDPQAAVNTRIEPFFLEGIQAVSPNLNLLF